MPLKNYTTEVEAAKTIGEIQNILQDFGIASIQTDYDTETRQPKAIRFAAFFLGKPLWFHLECKPEAVLARMRADKVPPRYLNLRQAYRVGWRVIKDIIHSNLAGVSIDQVDVAQVFLGFAVDADGVSTYQVFTEQRKKALTAGEGK